MSKIILTSFKKSKKFKGEKYSVARWQPQGFNYKSLDFLAAKNRFGNALHLSSYRGASLSEYKKDWLDTIFLNWEEVDNWIFNLENEKKEIVLCCWCPYSKSTQEQIKKYGVFACHTGLIGQLIKEHASDIRVILDDDRKNFLVKEWRP